MRRRIFSDVFLINVKISGGMPCAWRANIITSKGAVQSKQDVVSFSIMARLIKVRSARLQVASFWSATSITNQLRLRFAERCVRFSMPDEPASDNDFDQEVS
jgi:hypothetical protein